MKVLTDPWYHGFIEQVLDKIPASASPDAFTNALAMLNSAAMISNAIDSAFGHSADIDGQPSVVQELSKVASELGDIANSLTR